MAIRVIETNVEGKVPRSNPPLLKGLVSRSPKVAPKGRVKTKAIQNKRM